MSEGKSEANRLRDVEIAGRLVGPERRVFVVGEAGVCHNGSVDVALDMVDAAAEARVDAVKFQLFDAADLATANAAPAGYQADNTGATSQRELLARLQLSPAQIALIRRRCVDRSIPLILTPFSPAAVDTAVELGVAALKLSSTDLTNGPLMHRAAEAHLPMIVSVGASTLDEIATCVGDLLDRGLAGRLVLLHCVSCYPTPPEAANLRAVAALRRRFGVPSGYSDHTLSTQTGALAVAAGACLLEKHFTLDRGAVGPDHAMALTPAELTQYVAQVREAESAMGTGKLGMTDIEADVRRVARKSVVARLEIPAGTTIKAEMLTLKRPGHGIAPNELSAVIGRRAVATIFEDTVLTWDVVE